MLWFMLMLLNNQTLICIFHFIDNVYTVLLYKGSTNTLVTEGKLQYTLLLYPTSDNLLH